MSRPAWTDEIQNRLVELSTLKRGWDGYNGLPLSPVIRFFALNILDQICNKDTPLPSLVLGADGSLQIEWHINQCDLEIEINLHDISAWINDCQNGKEYTIDLGFNLDLSILRSWINDLSRDRK